MQHPSLNDDAGGVPANDAADDQALLAWSRQQTPGTTTFTEAQRLRSLLALVPPTERAQTLRALRDLTRPRR